jgi:hypothetical protein
MPAWKSAFLPTDELFKFSFKSYAKRSPAGTAIRGALSISGREKSGRRGTSPPVFI